jgi:REP element-mobilizing transposase RayT
VGDGRNEFDELERELCEALTTRPAPLGFATRVMAQIDAREKSAGVRTPFWRWLAASATLAAACLGLLAGTQYERHRERRIAGEHARQQVFLALHITGSTLEQVRRKVQQTGKDDQ